MEHLFVSENYENNSNILYIRENLCGLVYKGVKEKVSADRNRVGLSFNVEEDLYKFVGDDLADKISDVIAIAYKYRFFENRIKTPALSKRQRELLLTSLISADILDDKKYIRAKFKDCKQIAIDGFFNFRMANLKRKWEEICAFIPEFFSERELKEFIVYLINEKKGKKVIVDGDKVFDRRGNRLRKCVLLPSDEYLVVKELLLCGASEIEVKNMPNSEEEIDYIKILFGDKILFKSGENL